MAKYFMNAKRKGKTEKKPAHMPDAQRKAMMARVRPKGRYKAR